MRENFQKSFVVLLALALLVSFCACAASAPADPSDPDEGNAPDDPSALAVPFQVTSPEESAWQEVYLSGDTDYSTQAEADDCRRWLDGLKAQEVTGLYITTVPFGVYPSTQMSIEDSRQIYALLKSLAPDISPLPRESDPPTGGSWTIVVHAGDEVGQLTFNGCWLAFRRPGRQGYFLDVSDTPAQQSCAEIESLLGNYIQGIPENLPEDDTQLAVPLQMVLPGADVFQGGEWSYTSQGDEDVCRRWLYDLRAEDITALYGEESPLDYYWTGEMSLEDSRRVVDLLRSVAPYLTPLESGNPHTGGGWTIALYTKDEKVGFSFNGGWFTFAYQGTHWIFDAENLRVGESCNNIGGILSSYGSKGYGPSDGVPASSESPAAENTSTTRYFGEDVQAIYAIDRENYVMAQVKDGSFHSRDIWEGLENRVSSNGEPSGYGYLILTDKGREYIYLNDSDKDELLNYRCVEALNDGLLHPSWLIHMTPDRIEKISGLEEGGTTDRDKLLSLAKFLKEEVTVRPKASVFDGADNPDTVGGLYHWVITFDSGVYYSLIGYGGEDYLSLYSSDLNRTVRYWLDDGVDRKFLAKEGR